MRSNKENNITGCLIYYSGQFIQLIEGDVAVIDSIFRKIVLDSRHSDISLLCRSRIDEREFGNWSMAYYNIDVSTPMFYSVSEKEFKNMLVTVKETTKAKEIFKILAKGLLLNSSPN